MNRPMTRQEWLSYLEQTWDAAQEKAWSEQSRREWVGLTQQEQASVLASVPTVPFEGDWHLALFTAIEAKLKKKNT